MRLSDAACRLSDHLIVLVFGRFSAELTRADAKQILTSMGCANATIPVLVNGLSLGLSGCEARHRGRGFPLRDVGFFGLARTFTPTNLV